MNRRAVAGGASARAGDHRRTSVDHRGVRLLGLVPSMALLAGLGVVALGGGLATVAARCLVWDS